MLRRLGARYRRRHEAALAREAAAAAAAAGATGAAGGRPARGGRPGGGRRLECECGYVHLGREKEFLTCKMC